jgi:hypothetical protein
MVTAVLTVFGSNLKQKRAIGVRSGFSRMPEILLKIGSNASPADFRGRRPRSSERPAQIRNTAFHGFPAHNRALRKAREEAEAASHD